MAISRWEITGFDKTLIKREPNWAENRTVAVNAHDVTDRCPPSPNCYPRYKLPCCNLNQCGPMKNSVKSEAHGVCSHEPTPTRVGMLRASHPARAECSAL